MLPDPQPQKIACTVEEATALTGLGRTTLYNLIGSQQLRSVKIGGRRLIPYAALVELVEGGAE